MAPFSTLGVGGEAQWFTRAETISDVAAAHAWCVERQMSLFALGGGSNLVFADEGIAGLVLQLAIRGVQWSERDGEVIVRAGAGEPWDPLVAAAVSRGLAGIECLSGIPGSVGGTPIQNVGAYGQEIATTVDEVRVFDRRTGGVATLSPDECGFSYRMSRFKRSDADRFIVCDVALCLRSGAPTAVYPDVIAHLQRAGIASPSVTDVRNAVLAIRKSKGMVIDAADPDTRSVGSFFTNPVVGADVHERIVAAHPEERVPRFAAPGGAVKIPAAWLIEHAGFSRGYTEGRVGLSSKHPLAIINKGGATARDVLGLAVRIKRRVADQFDIRLQPEPVFAGFRDDDDVEYLRAVKD